MSLDDIYILYPNTHQINDFLTINVVNDIFVCIDINCSKKTCYSYDNSGNDYSEKLNNSIDYVLLRPHNENNKLILILQQFKDQFYKISGFDTTDDETLQDFPEYNQSQDMFFQKMKLSADPNRNLHIITYGTQFIVDTPKGCQKVYNAAILRGSSKSKIGFKTLLKLRGTNKKIQYDVRGAELFEQFIETMIKEIEQNNYTKIAIVCNRGHHRSVSCAEMLRYIYNNIVVTHLTLE